MTVRWSKDSEASGSASADAIDQRDLVAEATVCDRQHLGAQVDSGHPESPPQELRRDQPRPGRHVEHVAAARKARDEEAAPERVLSQRERGADAVVGRPERGEQLAGVLFQTPRWHPSSHPLSIVGSAAMASGAFRMLGSEDAYVGVDVRLNTSWPRNASRNG